MVDFARGFAVLALALVVVAFFAAGAFFVVDVALASVFFGAAFLVAVALGLAVSLVSFVSFASLVSFYTKCQ